MNCAALAHPLGNNTVNRQAWLQLSADNLQLRYLLDIAEIPTLLEAQKADQDGDGSVSPQEWTAYVDRWAAGLVAQLQIDLDGHPIALQLQTRHVWLQAGAADLSTLRLEANYRAPLGDYPKEARELHYRDDYSARQSGWKEIRISANNAVTITRSTAPSIDRSSGLTQYNASLTTPPSELTADATFLLSNASSTIAEREPLRDNAPPPHDVLTPVSRLPSSILQQASSFFKLGIFHIATGWDHLVFLLGLLLLVKSLPQLVKTITAFTIAHSLTLALAANHWVTPPGSWVEPGIALTIAYVGLISLARRQGRHGAWLAFGFGTVHGFGFAGALQQTLAHDPLVGQHWLLDLLAFNLGIETFQLVLVCLVVPCLRLAAAYNWFETVRQVASLGVFGAGVVWFLLRTVAR